MGLEKLKELWAAALKKAEDVRAKAGAENRVLTTEERGIVDAALAEMDSLDEDIKREEAILARAASAPKKQQVRPTPAASGTVTEVHDNAEDRPFNSFGEQLRAIRTAAESRGMTYDPRLRKFDLSDVSVRAAAGMNEKIGGEGGFLVGEDMGALLQKAVFNTGVLAGKTNRIPISSNSNGLKLPYIDETSRANGSRWGGVSATWLDEATAITPTKPKFGFLELKLRKVAALAYMTDELLEDSTASQAYLTQAIAEELQFAVDDKIIRGTGAGVPLGILNAPCTVSVAKETAQAAATILYANVSKMRARMLPRSFARAEWFINVNCMPQLETLFAPHTNAAGSENVGGQSVWQPPRGAADPPNGVLFGRPVNVIEHAETIGTVGDIMLLDLSQYIMITKGGVQSASSIHVNFLTDETAFRFVLRTDGQPALKSAIAPYKGTGSLSPFVTLATRA